VKRYKNILSILMMTFCVLIGSDSFAQPVSLAAKNVLPRLSVKELPAHPTFPYSVWHHDPVALNNVGHKIGRIVHPQPTMSFLTRANVWDAANTLSDLGMNITVYDINDQNTAAGIIVQFGVAASVYWLNADFLNPIVIPNISGFNNSFTPSAAGNFPSQGGFIVGNHATNGQVRPYGFDLISGQLIAIADNGDVINSIVDVNDISPVIGAGHSVNTNGDFQAIYWTQLNTLPVNLQDFGEASRASTVNNLGHAAGFATRNGEDRPVIWRGPNAAPRELAPANIRAAAGSTVTGMNDRGNAVGTLCFPVPQGQPLDCRAFLWHEPTQTFFEINQLVGQNINFNDNDPEINNFNEILVRGVLRSVPTVSRAFLIQIN
jgi:hypothetical protein